MSANPRDAREFQDALKFLLAREGGYVDHPSDPGGETNLGISRRSYPNENIVGMTRERAGYLYHRDYWLPNRCDEMTRWVALPLFDFAVNAPARSARICLQKIIGAKADGVLGPRSMAALTAAVKKNGETWVGLQLIDARLQRYIRRVRQGRSSPKFLLGWTRRLHHLIIELYEGELHG